MVPEVQAQGFQKLQTARPGAMGPFEFVRLETSVAWLRGSPPARLGEHDEAVRMGLLPVRNVLFEVRARAAGDIDQGLDVLPVHDRQNFLRSGELLRAALELGQLRGPGKVRVKVDYQAAAWDLCLGYVQHAPRFVPGYRKVIRRFAVGAASAGPREANAAPAAPLRM